MAVASAQAPANSSAIAPNAGTTPVHRLGEQMFDFVADIGGIAQFSGLTFAWLFRKRPRWSVLVPSFYAIGVSSVPVVAITGTFIGMVLAVQAYSQFEMMGLATPAGLGHQHLAGEGAGPGPGGDDARRPRRVGDGGRAGHDARHRADRRPLGAGDQPDPLPGRPAVPGLLPADPAADADGRLHGRHRRRGGQHPVARGRFVRLLAAFARVRRGRSTCSPGSSRASSSARRSR